jgi:ribosome-associated toxin RatA of RatAB toxin-antitoxin module
MSPPSPTPPVSRQYRRRWRLPLAVLVVLLASGAWFVVRGSWADPEKRFPRSVAAGPLTHLCRTPTGSGVHSAILIDLPAEKVWNVIQDFESHPRFLPFVSTIEIDRLEAELVRINGVAHSSVWGDWPFAMRIRYRAEPNGGYSALWDEPSEHLAANRGGWNISAKGEQETLVSLFIEVETTKYQRFFVNNLLLNRLSKVMLAVRDEAKLRAARP